MVPGAGIEPARPEGRQILSLLNLYFFFSRTIIHDHAKSHLILLFQQLKNNHIFLLH